MFRKSASLQSLALLSLFISLSLSGCAGVFPQADQNLNPWYPSYPTSYTVKQTSKTNGTSNTVTQSSSTTVQENIPNGQTTHTTSNSTSTTSGSSSTKTNTIVIPD